MALVPRGGGGEARGVCTHAHTHTLHTYTHGACLLPRLIFRKAASGLRPCALNLQIQIPKIDFEANIIILCTSPTPHRTS